MAHRLNPHSAAQALGLRKEEARDAAPPAPSLSQAVDREEMLGFLKRLSARNMSLEDVAHLTWLPQSRLRQYYEETGSVPGGASRAQRLF